MESTSYKPRRFVTKQNSVLNGDTLCKNIIIDLQILQHRGQHYTVTWLHRNRLVYFISKDLSFDLL